MVTVENRNSMNGFMFLLVLALCVDLFTPYLIWKHIIPAEIRWVSHFAIALMIVITVMRMLGFRKVPRAAWLILTISILWGYVAIGHGQGLLASVWGIWLFFQFPFVGLFVYLQPNIPEQLPALIYKYGIALLGLETFAQFLQYAAGTTPGDSLSGLFGESGTTKAVMFAILICCIGFGYWVAYRRGGGTPCCSCAGGGFQRSRRDENVSFRDRRTCIHGNDHLFHQASRASQGFHLFYMDWTHYFRLCRFL